MKQLIALICLALGSAISLTMGCQSDLTGPTTSIPGAAVTTDVSEPPQIYLAGASRDGKYISTHPWVWVDNIPWTLNGSGKRSYLNPIAPHSPQILAVRAVRIYREVGEFHDDGVFVPTKYVLIGVDTHPIEKSGSVYFHVVAAPSFDPRDLVLGEKGPFIAIDFEFDNSGKNGRETFETMVQRNTYPDDTRYRGRGHD